MPPCGQPCGRNVDRGAPPVEWPVEGVDSAVGDTPGGSPPRLLSSHNGRAHGVDGKIHRGTPPCAALCRPHAAPTPPLRQRRDRERCPGGPRGRPAAGRVPPRTPPLRPPP